MFFIFCIIISYITLLLIVIQHAIPRDIGIAIKAVPVRLNVIEFQVVATITSVSNDFSSVVNISYFWYFFLDL